MKNSTLIKGTAAIAVGAALLLGGGGTLAAWNDTAMATPGSIVSGDLDVVAAEGTWTNSADADVTEGLEDGTYTVVPGDVLTFTQNLDVTLKGDNMAATISTTGWAENGGLTSSNVSVSRPAIKVNGETYSNSVLNESEDTQKVTASITFTFSADTAGRDDVNTTFNFDNVAFTLQQVIA
ncbi:alternate-type signal peptide domain-containing protein [Arthrobacter sp. S1_S22]|nr:alternate-type signal peptide domain-containing protein [Arthrobacter sp. S1_S22]